MLIRLPRKTHPTRPERSTLRGLSSSEPEGADTEALQQLSHFSEAQPVAATHQAITAVGRAPNRRRGTPAGRSTPVRFLHLHQRWAIIWYSVTRTASGSSSTT